MNKTQKFALSVVLGALGNVIGFSSLELLTFIHPQIALDLSHIGTFLSAGMLGPAYGGLTGAIVAISPYIRFGLQGAYGPLFGFLIIPGKALSGIFSSILMRRVRPFTAIIIGYMPESIFTYVTMAIWAPIFLPGISQYITGTIVAMVLLKAWAEILVLAALTEPILRSLCKRHFIWCYYKC
ncbi:MAG: hypothetical protein ACP5KE_01465 [Candidatus Methanodesulfokora sp.]